MKTTTTVIIGAGQSGLAFSKQLSARSVDHVVLERGDIAQAWRSERWDSLRLLTPNWQTRLEGYRYNGPDPDGYMSAADVAAFLGGYAAYAHEPVETHTHVLAVTATEGGYRVETTKGDWLCSSLVAATGACSVANVPALDSEVLPSITSLSLMDYKSPNQLEDGGVLVVGASASGAQLAKEIQAAGHQVTLSTGEHVRLPRVYRGQDICWWMNETGLMDTHYQDVEDLRRARKVASLQLMGSDERCNIDLNTLQTSGIRIVGRLQGMREGTALFSGALRNHCMLADLKMNRLLENVDEWVSATGRTHEFEPAHRFRETRIAEETPLSLYLPDENIKTIIWATGFKPDFSWLHLPVFDRKGALRHDGGIATDVDGLYVMGLPFMRRRKSSYIDGVADDAADLADHLTANLNRRAA
ncbi:MAG: NAD(P)-binding domain-containing protein [Pseudomonadota bacterium]